MTLVLGVNDDAYDLENHNVISNASCTTNCLGPVAQVLHDDVGIERGHHDHDPRLHGGPAPPGRAAQGPPPRPRRRGQPDPDLTGAAKAIGLVIPELEASSTASPCARR